MKTLSLTVNGRTVRAEIEPRLSLVDFLRDHQALTATHVGCEHGVCGACTVLLDGEPARSCITFAAAADGATVTTLEGFENDPVMNALREGFAEQHGLQCGFCTPGMLMTGRDILTRLPDADEKRIRLELSGNLCRCTGYVGIVKGIQSAQAALNKTAATEPRQIRRIGPVGSHRPSAPPDLSRRPAPAAAKPAPAVRMAAENFDAIDWSSVDHEGVELRQSFTVAFPRADVWRFFADLDQVARCMPGARLTKPEQDGRAEGEVNIKLGPIVSAFHGVLDSSRDEENFRGMVRGAGRDDMSRSIARAVIAYAVHSTAPTASQVDVSVKFLLSGALAQFSRSGLVHDVAGHLTERFAKNLEARLAGRPAPATGVESLDAGALARAAIRARITAFFRNLFGGR